MDSQNPYPKSKVINAAKNTLVGITQDRENERTRLCSGHKQFGFFGRVLTINEAWDKLKPLDQTLVGYLYLGQEVVVQRILSAAEKCVGDTINLTARELELIEKFWE